jgi:hypothetical protein
LPSASPANQEATNVPSLASTIVVAWQLGTGFFSKMNSERTKPGSAAATETTVSKAAKA